MSFFRQVWAVTVMNLAALPSRAGASLVTVIGVATVIAVMLSLLGIGEGVLHAGLRNDQPDRAIVLSSGASELMGSFSKADVAQIAEAPGVAHTPDGRAMVQPNASVIVELQAKAGATNNAVFTGSGEIGRLMNSGSFRIIQGRTYQSGLHELIAGVAAQRMYKNLDVGDTVVLRGTPWKVVGIFEDQGGIDENAVVSDADTVLAAFNRTSYQSVLVKLTSPGAFRQFKDAVMSYPLLQV